MLTALQVVQAIKKYNLKVQPCLAKKKEGDKNYWSAGQMIAPTVMSNYIKDGTLAFGSSLEEAIEKSVALINKHVRDWGEVPEIEEGGTMDSDIAICKKCGAKLVKAVSYNEYWNPMWVDMIMDNGGWYYGDEAHFPCSRGN